MQALTRIVGVALLSGVIGWTLGCEQPIPSDRTPETPTTPEAESPPTPEQTTPTASGPESPGADTAVPEEIDILCGTSFGPPMEELVKRYQEATGGDAILIFGGSEDHLPKVKLKAAGDIYVTHTPYMQYTHEAGALLREIPVGFLAPVLVVQEGNPKGLKRIEDLARPGLKVVLTSPEFSTCGEMVFALLEKKGIKDAVMENVGSDLVKHHAMVGNHLQIGARDAGIMWNGVANNFRDDITIVPIPYEYDEEIRVAVLGLSYTEKKESVERFLDFIAEHGREVFAEHHGPTGQPERYPESPRPHAGGNQARTGRPEGLRRRPHRLEDLRKERDRRGEASGGLPLGHSQRAGQSRQAGHLDAAIVWDAVAAQFGDDVETVAIPVEQNQISTVAAGVLGSSKEPQTAAAFAAFLASPEGRDVFRKHHYTVESPF